MPHQPFGPHAAGARRRLWPAARQRTARRRVQQGGPPAAHLAALPCAHAAHDPAAFDADKLITPEDADTLGLEDSIAGQLQQDAERRPLRLQPMAMAMFSAPLDEREPSLNGMVQVDATLRRGAFGAQVTPRLRIGDAAHPLAETVVMLQQAMLFFRAGNGEVKFGKVLGQFGRTWDYGLYGPLMAAHDVKLDPGLGASFELSQPIVAQLDLEVVGQYFVIDGRALSVRNPSLFSTARARHKHIAGARVVPVWHLGEARLSAGLSGQHFTSERPHPHQVWRTAFDASVDHPRVGAFVEVGRQDGEDMPSSDEVVSSFAYVWTGMEIRLPPVSLRYHFNAVRYAPPTARVDLLHQGGLEWTASPKVSLVLESAFWRDERSIYLAGFLKL